jgi:UDP-N-acetylglucosamine transferase subunit ALG13
VNILFAIHDWGLGHATRGLMLVRALLDAGHSVTILSAGRAMRLLRQELNNSYLPLSSGAFMPYDFIELQDIPKPLSRRAAWFYVKMSLSLPLVFKTFQREQQVVEELCRERNYDRIISDSRYGVWSRDVPSFYLVHSLRQIIPGRPRQLEKLVEYSQRRLLGKAQKILIPDQQDNGLAGDLCHDIDCDWGGRLEYIGILSSVARTTAEPDIDYFISVSGAEPQRSIFEKIVLEQVHQLNGKVVVALGKPDSSSDGYTLYNNSGFSDNGRIEIHQYMNRAQQQEMMNRARLVISRSGYTTLMELAELGKKALLIPTVGQSEQEYLAGYHERLGHLHTVRQRDLNLAHDVAEAERYKGLPPTDPTRRSVQRFLGAVGC